MVARLSSLHINCWSTVCKVHAPACVCARSSPLIAGECDGVGRPSPSHLSLHVSLTTLADTALAPAVIPALALGVLLVTHDCVLHCAIGTKLRAVLTVY